MEDQDNKLEQDESQEYFIVVDNCGKQIKIPYTINKNFVAKPMEPLILEWKVIIEKNK